MEGQFFNYFTEFNRLKQFGLSQTEVDMFQYINTMCLNSKDSKCWCTNEQFADLFVITKRQVQKCIEKLINLGLIERKIVKGINGFDTRYVKSIEKNAIDMIRGVVEDVKKE